MRRSSWAILLGLCVTALSPLHAEIDTIYSDNGVPNVPPNQVIVFPNNDGEIAIGAATDVSPPEGQTSFKLIQPSLTFGGWGVSYAAPENLSRFNGGELRFWIRSTTGDLKIEIKNSASDVYSHTLTDLGWSSAQSSQWVEYRLPMTGVDLSAVANPFLATAITGPAVFYVDNVRYVDSVADPIFNVSVLNRADQSSAATLTWTSASASGPTWALADQYLNVVADANVFSWGIQLYTNNTASDANPAFVSSVAVGDSGSNPAGLVDTSVPSHTLALAWSVKAGTTVPTGLAAPSDASNPDSFQWFYVQDQATPAISAEQTTAFTNADPYITFASNAGIHYAQSPSSFGGASSPYKIYFEAPVGSALRPRTYQTTTLRVEFFYP